MFPPTANTYVISHYGSDPGNEPNSASVLIGATWHKPAMIQLLPTEMKLVESSVKPGMCQFYTFMVSVCSSAPPFNSILLSSWMWSIKSKRSRKVKKCGIDKKFPTKHNVQIYSPEELPLSCGPVARAVQISLLQALTKDKHLQTERSVLSSVEAATTGTKTQRNRHIIGGQEHVPPGTLCIKSLLLFDTSSFPKVAGPEPQWDRLQG